MMSPGGVIKTGEPDGPLIVCGQGEYVVRILTSIGVDLLDALNNAADD